MHKGFTMPATIHLVENFRQSFRHMEDFS